LANNTLIAEIPLGLTGLNGSKNMSQVPITSLISAENISYANGTIEKEGGATKYNSTTVSGSPSILGGHDWNHDGGTQRMVIFGDNGRLLKDTGGGDFTVTLATGLTTTDVIPVFVEGGKEVAANNRKLFTYTGANAIQSLSADGATTASVASGFTTDWSGSNNPTFGVMHENILWGGGNANDPNRMYYSTATDHEVGDGSIAVYPGDDEKLVGGVSYKGGLICFKYPRGIYLIDTSDSTVANWRVKLLNDEIGVAGVRAYARVENDVLFMDSSGDIRLLSSTDEFGDIGTESLSDKQDMGPWIRENVDMAQSDQFIMTYYPTKREAHLACTEIGSTTNNLRIVMDFNVPGTVKFRTSKRDTPVSMWTRQVSRVPQLVHGTSSGFVYTMDTSAFTKDSAGYAAEFQTPHTDLSYIDPKLSTKRKNMKFLELVTEPLGNWDLSVDVYLDGEFSQTVDFNMGSAGAILGSFALDTDRLGGNSINNRKRRIVGSGRRVSFVARNSGDGQGFSAARLFLHYNIGNERL